MTTHDDDESTFEQVFRIVFVIALLVVFVVIAFHERSPEGAVDDRDRPAHDDAGYSAPQAPSTE